MKILFVDQFATLAGAQRCLLDLLPALDERHWTAEAAISGEGPLPAALAERGIPVHPLHCGPFSNGRKSAADFVRFAAALPRLARRLQAILEQARPDLLYVNGPRVLPAAAWAAHSRIPLLFHAHNRLTQRYAARLAGQSLRRARATLVACCRFALEPLVPYVPVTRRHVVYSGVPALTAAPRTFAPDSPWRIGVLGRIAPQKGQAEFLHAARIVAASGGAPCRFVICGAAAPADARYDAQVRALAEGLPVSFLGWRDNVAAVLADLDLLVVPSVGVEAAPRVILEAFSAGVPVIAFRSGGIPEVLEDRVTGALLDDPRPDPLARTILQMIAAPRWMEAVAGAAQAKWRERFTVERYRAELAEIIERAASRASRAAA